jgi:hypothetical protein
MARAVVTWNDHTPFTTDDFLNMGLGHMYIRMVNNLILDIDPGYAGFGRPGCAEQLYHHTRSQYTTSALNTLHIYHENVHGIFGLGSDVRLKHGSMQNTS